jgi:hypothetical protein
VRSNSQRADGEDVYWGDWLPVGGLGSTATLATVSDIENAIHLLAVDTSGTTRCVTQVVHVPDPTWTAPRTVDAPPARNVLAVQRLDARSAAVLETTDGGLLLGHRTDDGWVFDVALPAGRSPEQLAVNSDGRLELFGRDHYGRTWHCYQKDAADDTAWVSWTQLEQFNSIAARTIDVRADALGVLTLLGVSDKGVPWLMKQDPTAAGGWGPWTKAGDAIQHAWLGADLYARLELFAVGGGTVSRRAQGTRYPRSAGAT